jgi:hypothetical protein
MTQYRFTAEQRAAFRKAITSHPSWDFYRQMKMLTASALSVDDMLKAAAELNPPIDPSLYGTVKSFNPHGQPKPKPYDKGVTDNLFARFQEHKIHLSYRTEIKASEIFETIYQKQEGRMSEGQHKALSTIINEAHARSFKSDPAPYSAPEPVATPAPSIDPLNMSKVNPMINTTSTPAPSAPVSGDVATALHVLMTAMGQQGQQQGLTEAQVIALINQHSGKPATVNLNLTTPTGVKSLSDRLMHYKVPLLLSAVNAGVNVMLVGPAGSGKTTAAEQVAEALDLPFYFTGAIDSAYKLTGFIDAQGRTIRTAFRDAYERGGIFLFDELDASMPSAVLAFNAALANGQMDFPDGTVKRHADFRAVAACNTFGRGADRQYVGRLQLDGASLDRFVTLAWDYDSALEAALIGLSRPNTAPPMTTVNPITDEASAASVTRQWHEFVTKCRARAEMQKIRHVISPRATMNGVKLLLAGWPLAEVQESALYKGLDSDSRSKIAC